LVWGWGKVQKNSCKGKLSEKKIHAQRVAQKKVPAHGQKKIPVREMLTKKIVQLENTPCSPITFLMVHPSNIHFSRAEFYPPPTNSTKKKKMKIKCFSVCRCRLILAPFNAPSLQVPSLSCSPILGVRLQQDIDLSKFD